jgi:hypothetical protein
VTGQRSACAAVGHLESDAAAFCQRFKGLRQFRQELGDAKCLSTEHFATSKHQHVLDQMFQVLQARHRLLRNGGAAGRGEFHVLQISRIKQRCRQRRAQLVRQLRRHFTHRGQPLVAFGLGLEVLRLGHVVQQHDAPAGRIKRRHSHRQPSRAGQEFARRFTGFQRIGLDRRPASADYALAQNPAGRRIGLYHAACASSSTTTPAGRASSRAQALGQCRLLLILLAQRAVGGRQFPSELGHLSLQFAVGRRKLLRRLTEYPEGLGEAFRFAGSDRRTA